jgi:glycerol uptake facilitator-like aquaporin
MMWNKYFIEFMGVVTIIYAKLLTEADPTVMAIVYFAMFSIAKDITTGFFTPIGSLSAWMIGRVPTHEFLYNVIAQVAGAVFVAIAFLPTKTYMEHI